jgi:antibiotic biosynthesis monooxygenase (ABM) superfamily enzyme
VFFFLGEPLQRLPLGIRTLVVTGIVVPALIYVVLPIMTPLFERWLYPRESRDDVQEGTDPSRRG